MKTCRFDSDVKLHGLIYLHNINEQRMNRIALTSLEVFGGVCGKDFLQNTVLVTTKWDKVHADDMEVACETEKELKGDYWKQYLQHGALYSRSPNTQAGCKAIVARIVKNATQISRLEKEVMEGLSLGETTAGAGLESEIRKINAENQRRLDELRLELERARSEDNERAGKRLQMEVDARQAQELANKRDLAKLESKAELRAIKSDHNNWASRFNREIGLPPTTSRASNLAILEAEIQKILVTMKAIGDEENEAVQSATAALECDVGNAKTMVTAEKARLKNELVQLKEIETSLREWRTKFRAVQRESATGARATTAREVHEGFIELSDRLRSLVRGEVVGVHELVDTVDRAVKSSLEWLGEERIRIKKEEDKAEHGAAIAKEAAPVKKESSAEEVCIGKGSVSVHVKSSKTPSGEVIMATGQFLRRIGFIERREERREERRARRR